FRDAHLGHWKMNHDGWKGDLYLNAGGGAEAVVGNYLDRESHWHSVQGSMSGRNFRFQIWFDGYGWQQFSGYLYSWDKGLMAGITGPGFVKGHSSGSLQKPCFTRRSLSAPRHARNHPCFRPGPGSRPV